MKKLFLMALLVMGLVGTSIGQFSCTLQEGELVSSSGGPCNNIVLSAVPFLRITPDARTGSLGDAGLAISPSATSVAFNASKLAFSERSFEVSATYTPWLRELGVTDVYLAYLSGYYKIDDLQAVTGSLRFFNIGDVQFTDQAGMSLGTGKPVEFEILAGYARKLSDNFSIGLSGKFIYSDLASGVFANGQEIVPGTSVAADISATYMTDIGAAGNTLTVAMALTNLGSKIGYVEGLTEDFIPTNLGIGGAYTMQIDDFNKITLAIDINKLMVPTPIPSTMTDENGMSIDNPDFDKDGNGIADFREQALFEGVFGSFGDAPEGFEEELRELSYSFAAEYWYNDVFAFRLGHFNEHRNKGNRKYITAGAGVVLAGRYGVDFSYLIPTTIERSPLDNTLRFSLNLLGPSEFVGRSSTRP